MWTVGGVEASANIHPIAENVVPHQSTRNAMISKSDCGG
jgi:hypothetical protein